MLNIKKYYEMENNEIRENYENSLNKIQKIAEITQNSKDPYNNFLAHTSKSILKFANLEKQIDDDYFTNKTFEELKEENYQFFSEVLPENYTNSYANPAYCVNIFGNQIGQLISYFYVKYRQYITYAFTHKLLRMEEDNKIFIDVFNYIQEGTPKYEPLRKVIFQNAKKDSTKKFTSDLKDRFDPNFNFFSDIVEQADLSDFRYLFKYSNYVTKTEIQTAKFLQSYPQEKIDNLCRQIVKAYFNGFKTRNKSMGDKTVVTLMFNAGQERIIQQLIKEFQESGLQVSIPHIFGSNANKQYGYDHRFDNALYLDEEYIPIYEKSMENAWANCQQFTSQLTGMIPFSKFGELPFHPQNKEECLQLSSSQLQLLQKHYGTMMQIQEKYFPSKGTSFSAISFPSPEIGDNFEQIFEDILEINMLDTEKYEPIQQKIIDALDKAQYVHVKGKNKTDITVQMHEIKNPQKETNFLNCGADINIPLGEVYTSPQLKGTNGVLHIEESFLNELKFVDLELTFKDGYIVDYMCNNFESEEENKKYLEENLLFPHKTLPIGEFAIGTNTLAYVIAKKHDIIPVLPVLILEKMGPHFAIGDTCFTHNEDEPIFNQLDGKEVIARENEKSALRKTNPQEAYTNKHTDITVPYESIEFISAITKDGEKIDIIRDGRFVLEGTEELNKPFEM